MYPESVAMELEACLARWRERGWVILLWEFGFLMWVVG